MKKTALLAALAGANVFERISRRARVNWKDLIDEGPLWDSAMMDYQGDEPQQIANSEAFVFDRDDFLNDDPFSNDYFETEEVKPLTLVTVTGEREDFGEENDVCWESCDAPQECLCKNCCVEKKITCPVDVVVALDVCHCDNSRWIKTIEFVTHLTEEFKERVDDFRLSVVLFNEISEIAFSLSDWDPTWTLEDIYSKLDNHDLIDFYGRGTFLHTGVEFAMKQFDHDLKRKALLVLYSNGLSQSSDTEVLDVVNNFLGPKIVSVTADALYDTCNGPLCPNKQLLSDMSNNMVLDGSGRRQFWAAKQVRTIAEESFVCHERACEWCDCDCDFSCENTEALAGIRKEECQNCPMIPCPVDIIFAIDMCHCDPLRMEVSKDFIAATADKLIIDSEARGQKVRLSVVQFNEVAVTSTHFVEFNGDAADKVSLNDFKENLKNLPFEQFKGMGTKLTTGIDEARKTFEFESMTQDDRDRLGIFTNKTEKVLILHSNGHSIDSRVGIMKTINGIKEDFDVKVIPVSVDSPSFKTHDPTAPDAVFLNRIKDKKLSNFVDGTKLDQVAEAIDAFVMDMECGDIRCENPCPFEEREFPNPKEPALCPNVFGEFNPINPAEMASDLDKDDLDEPDASSPSEIYMAPCKALNLAFIIDGSDSVTGRPNGGEWKTVRDWVGAVIDELNLETRPGISNVAVMQYAADHEIIEQKWWPMGCDPQMRSSGDLRDKLAHWRQMNTTTNTYKATTAMMDFHDDNNAQLSENQFNVLVLISDGEHRDAWRKKQSEIDRLRQTFDMVQVVKIRENRQFHNLDDWQLDTSMVKSLRTRPNWGAEELDFLQECEHKCGLAYDASSSSDSSWNSYSSDPFVSSP